MENIFWWFVGLIVLIVVLAILWKALEKGLSLFPNMSATVRVVIEIVALIFLAAVIIYLFGQYGRLPFP